MKSELDLNRAEGRSWNWSTTQTVRCWTNRWRQQMRLQQHHSAYKWGKNTPSDSTSKQTRTYSNIHTQVLYPHSDFKHSTLINTLLPFVFLICHNCAFINCILKRQKQQTEQNIKFNKVLWEMLWERFEIWDRSQQYIGWYVCRVLGSCICVSPKNTYIGGALFF